MCVCVHNFNDLQTSPLAFLARKLTVDIQRQAEWGKYNAKEDIAASYEWERTGDRRPETGPVLYFQLFGVERAMERWNGKDCSNMQLRWPEAMQRILQRPGKNVQVKNKLSFEWLAALCVCVLHIMRVPFLGPFFFSRLVGWAGLSPAAGRSLVYLGDKNCDSSWPAVVIIGSRHSVLFLNYMPLLCYPLWQVVRPRHAHFHQTELSPASCPNTCRASATSYRGETSAKSGNSNCYCYSPANVVKGQKQTPPAQTHWITVALRKDCFGACLGSKPSGVERVACNMLHCRGHFPSSSNTGCYQPQRKHNHHN